jgi:hypothetical protein
MLGPAKGIAQVHSSESEKVSELFSESRPSILDAN